MSINLSRRKAIAGTLAFGVASRAALAAPEPSAALQAALDYAQAQNTTGFLIIRDRRTVVARSWLPCEAASSFAGFVYGRASDGSLLEDVASQQKSIVAVLVAIAVDKRLLDIEAPVSRYLGSGWSKASPDQEARIRTIDLLTMSSGLNTDFTFAAPPATTFLYNTPVYAVTKRILTAAAQQPLEALTRDWLTKPAGMQDTSWRVRPAALADAGNPTGLVTCPRDLVTFGQIALDRGRASDGRRIVSERQLAALLTPSATNPAYGRLWWLNGSSYAIRAPAIRRDGPLVPAAPADMVAALGLLDRKLYVVPSRKLVIVRMGAAVSDRDFDQQLWSRLAPALATN